MRYAQQRTETRTLSLLIINLSRSLGDDEKYKKSLFSTLDYCTGRISVLKKCTIV